MKAVSSVPAILHLDAAVLDLEHVAGDDRRPCACRRRVASSPASAAGALAELLDAERDALLLDVDVEHLGLDLVALLVVLHRVLARLASSRGRKDGPCRRRRRRGR